MTTRPEALGDTSAWIALRRGRPSAVTIVGALLRRGTLAVCGPVRLELLRGARNPGEVISLRERLALLPQCPVAPSAWARAEEIIEQLSRRRGGRHRGIPPVDLLIAAAAEASSLPVLHDDEHFDLIAEITGQPVVRLA
jgi:predicted nucleic acid-binding protein